MVRSLGEQPYRAKQILHWLYQQDTDHIDQMSNLSNEFRRRLASVATVPFFQRFVRAAMMKQEPDEAAIRKAIDEDAVEVFDYLESELDGREFLAGGVFSIADIGTASFFVNMEHGGEKVDASRWPRLTDYLSRIHGRPSYKAIIEEEKAMVGGA